jgi:hypothetical protein
MRLTIINDDGAVYKDNLCFLKLNLLSIPDNVHALQWYENYGHIEYKSDTQHNENITELPSWANDCLAKWQEAFDLQQQELFNMQQQALMEAEKQALIDAQQQALVTK